MNEKGNKAVELKDEEIEQASGGKAASYITLQIAAAQSLGFLSTTIGGSGQTYINTDIPAKPGEVTADPREFLAPFGPK